MKKYILLAAAALMTLAATAQVENANRVILHAKDGTTHAYRFSELDYMEFDYVSECSVALTLVEGSLTDTSFSVDAVPGEECASYTVSYTASNAPSTPIDKGTYQGRQRIDFTGLATGLVYTVTVTPFSAAGDPGDASTLTCTVGTPAPKIGDYYYSDGTWSDGGLISIDADGQNAVWAEVKPEPLAGKTVVGIVCVTDPSRIAPEDREAGYTHGYVIGCKNATDPDKYNYALYPESIWYAANGSQVEVTKVTKVASTCYERVSGRQDTRDMLTFYGEGARYQVPMFYYCTAGYPVAAPASSSGWFVPSVGQLWDCVANFCSGPVAEYLKRMRSERSDITYWGEEVDQPVFDSFMRPFAKVPAADKDEMTINDGDYPPLMSLRTANRYDTEAALHFNLGRAATESTIEVMCGWFDEEGHARPFLAF